MNRQDQNHPPVLEQLAERAGQQIRESANQISEITNKATRGLEEGIDNIEIKLSDVRDSVVGKTKEYTRTANDYVKQNPWVVIGISAGFAFLAGMLIGRRRRD